MKLPITIDLYLTTDQLAEAFISWDDGRQADFINLIGKHFKKADFNAELQCAYLVDHIDKDGKDFVFTLANFLKVQKLPSTSPKIDALISSYDGDSL